MSTASKQRPGRARRGHVLAVLLVALAGLLTAGILGAANAHAEDTDDTATYTLVAGEVLDLTRCTAQPSTTAMTVMAVRSADDVLDSIDCDAPFGDIQIRITKDKILVTSNRHRRTRPWSPSSPNPRTG